MKMVVGLGNPGKAYNGTRHNLGFMILDSFVTDFKTEKKFLADIKKDKIGGEDVLFVKPLTMMNLSGNAVVKIAHYYHIELENILVVHDDLDLELGTYKLKRNSSSGGHNGINSIIQSLGSNAFLRLKVGISHNKDISTIDYVLGYFSQNDMQILEKKYDLFKNIILSFISNGTDKTFQQYNRK